MFPVHTKQMRKSADSSKVRSKLIAPLSRDFPSPTPVVPSSTPTSYRTAAGARRRLDLAGRVTQTPDAHTIALLERQCRELTAVLLQLERARHDLVPDSSDKIWRGSARHAYDAAMQAIVATMGAGAAALRSARDHSRLAIDQIAARG